MFQCCSLYSGSSGNSFFITTENTNILIDAGVSCKKIITALSSLNKDIKNINAILITHEHIDHTKSVASISNKYNIPVFATQKTWEFLSKNNFKNNNINFFEKEKEFTINDLKILPFDTPHDAVDPCGFKISKDEKTLCIATDLGYISPSIFKHFETSSFLMLESNYDPNILKISSYPYKLKQRIISNVGHLSNATAGEAISKLSSYNLKNALLIHLSQENNLPELALTTIKEILLKNNVDVSNIDVSVAPRNNPSILFNIS